MRHNLIDVISIVECFCRASKLMLSWMKVKDLLLK